MWLENLNGSNTLSTINLALICALFLFERVMSANDHNLGMTCLLFREVAVFMAGTIPLAARCSSQHIVTAPRLNFVSTKIK